MATIPEYPPILQGSTENKINQLREYLARMAKVQEDEALLSSKSGSGSSEPDAYLKTASVSGNTLTLTNKNDSTVQFTPTGGTGTTNFNQLSNRPSYNGVTMTGSTAIPEVKTSTWDGKQDKLIAGTNITIASDGKTISASGGGSEPAAYIKTASVTDNTLTLTKQDDSTVEFTPSGGGTSPSVYLKTAAVSGNTLTLTKQDNTEVTFTPESSGELAVTALTATATVTAGSVYTGNITLSKEGYTPVGVVAVSNPSANTFVKNFEISFGLLIYTIKNLITTGSVTDTYTFKVLWKANS